jgi:hypothetical protein
VAAPCCRSGRLFHGSGPAQRAASRRARKPFLTCTCSKRGAAQLCVRKALLALVGRLDGIGWASSRDVLIRDYTGFPMRCHGARCASAERLGNQRTRPLTEVAQSDIAKCQRRRRIQRCAIWIGLWYQKILSFDKIIFSCNRVLLRYWRSRTA